ncbi:GGDEF domain-containing protein [Neorhizobium sp. NCHU2750]|uniref:GGDEF domain-containing protein n=1 Tax=Neorhizobium sp. NCHU2750 TaxID=1825976 RepID=UPI0013C450F9
MDEAGVLVAVFDDQDRLCYANRAFRAAWFIGDDERGDDERLVWSELMRRNFHARQGTIIKARDFETWLSSTLSRRGKAGFRAFETDLHDGRWLWMTETTMADGWMLCVASDITSIRSDERTLRQDRDDAIKASQTDELTGVPSRRFVMAKLNDMLAAQEEMSEGSAGEARWGRVGCIAVLDIDNFKYINDRFGHSVGDLVLRDFAATLQRQIRKTDVFGRVGGEEFVLVLPNTMADEAETLVGRMLDAVRKSRPLPDQTSFRYTFSAGIASAESGETADDLYRRADLALYAAKMRGRDQISLDPNARLGSV